jgi:hypothetical protein
MEIIRVFLGKGGLAESLTLFFWVLTNPVFDPIFYTLPGYSIITNDMGKI